MGNVLRLLCFVLAPPLFTPQNVTAEEHHQIFSTYNCLYDLLRLIEKAAWMEEKGLITRCNIDLGASPRLPYI